MSTDVLCNVPENDEIVHHMSYQALLTWEEMDKSFKYYFDKVKVIRKTHKDGWESFAFSFNWIDPDNRRPYLYSVVIDKETTVIVDPAIYEISLNVTAVDATAKNILILGVWSEKGWQYDFTVAGKSL